MFCCKSAFKRSVSTIFNYFDDNLKLLLFRYHIHVESLVFCGWYWNFCALRHEKKKKQNRFFSSIFFIRLFSFNFCLFSISHSTKWYNISVYSTLDAVCIQCLLSKLSRMRFNEKRIKMRKKVHTTNYNSPLSFLRYENS